MDEKLLPFWKEIDEKTFSRFFFTFHFKKQKAESFLFDEAGNELEIPMLFVYTWDIQLNLSTTEQIGIAVEWRIDGLHYYQFGDPDILEKEKELLIAMILKR